MTVLGEVAATGPAPRHPALRRDPGPSAHGARSSAGCRAPSADPRPGRDQRPPGHRAPGAHRQVAGARSRPGVRRGLGRQSRDRRRGAARRGRTLYVFGKQLGTTSLTITDDGGDLIAVVDLVVSYDVEGLRAQLFELLPGERIEVRPASDGLVLSGRLSNASACSARSRSPSATPRQDHQPHGGRGQPASDAGGALRRGVQREVIKQLGAQTDFLFANGDVAIATDFGDTAARRSPELRQRRLRAPDAAISRSDVIFDALEQQGVVTTLAEPNLIALSGDTASFLAGGEFPIPVGQDNDGAEITVEFKPFGVSLSFTPTVLGSDLVNLEIVHRRSATSIATYLGPDQHHLVIPGLTTRRAQHYGGTAERPELRHRGAAAGRLPGHGAPVPWSSATSRCSAQLFRSNGYQLHQSELVVIVTPYLVRPATPMALLTPTDGAVLPTKFRPVPVRQDDLGYGGAGRPQGRN